MKQFSINHKHNEHETQEKVKTGGRVVPHPGWSLPPLVISDNASAHGPKRVKTEFWSGGGYYSWNMDASFSICSFLAGLQIFIIQERRGKQNKVLFHALFPIIGNTIILLLAETNDFL